ncbi:Uncharacterized protein BM_BM10756 [Brugia malayi]|uniref:Bm10756 n=1 Tax=Brugia malayi TaxID=6279 RepID=A0A0J9XZY2_BRUMA|nr:Uncharacterized protein BM_BM10756 [Brugia malayi]CDP99432.1 Bm10756 [Brugia malayi]VIO99881.1 Uncharacterized protein BM_BM10756 [Brugia malayi]
MKGNKKNFKVFDYKLQQDDYGGNIKLNDHDDILNARSARVNLDNTKQNDSNISKLDKGLSEKLVNDRGLLSEFDRKDEEIVQEERCLIIKLLDVLNNLDDLVNIESKDLLEVEIAHAIDIVDQSKK